MTNNNLEETIKKLQNLVNEQILTFKTFNERLNATESNIRQLIVSNKGNKVIKTVEDKLTNTREMSDALLDSKIRVLAQKKTVEQLEKWAKSIKEFYDVSDNQKQILNDSYTNRLREITENE